MDTDPEREQGPYVNKTGKKLPVWFKLAVIVLIGLVVAKALGLQVFVEVTFDGIPFLAALTDARIYLVPLLLILIYILSVWIWKKLFGPRDL